MHSVSERLVQRLGQLILGKEQEIRLALCCLLARGHLLLEDLPGMGKTTLAQGLATLLGLDYQRVQFTSDMLPADLLGVSVFTEQRAFVFHPGPVFTQVLLADEINRGSPRTQSALLEAMAERQVSIDRQTRPLPDPFFVIATQNPQDQAGTYPLPESQLDRFLMCLSLGYPGRETEKRMLMQAQRPVLQAMLAPGELGQMQAEVHQVAIAEAALNYLLDLVDASRMPGLVPNALSPRASQALLAAAKAWAYQAGRDHVLPDDIQAVFGPVAEHRMRHQSQAVSRRYQLSQSLLERVDPLR